MDDKEKALSNLFDICFEEGFKDAFAIVEAVLMKVGVITLDQFRELESECKSEFHRKYKE